MERPTLDIYIYIYIDDIAEIESWPRIGELVKVSDKTPTLAQLQQGGVTVLTAMAYDADDLATGFYAFRLEPGSPLILDAGPGEGLSYELPLAIIEDSPCVFSISAEVAEQIGEIEPGIYVKDNLLNYGELLIVYKEDGTST